VGKAERTRAGIIHQVAEIFNRKGYAGTSLHDLTEKTQLTKGGIYGNFADKEEVAAEALKYNLSRIAEKIGEEQSLATCDADRLRAYPNTYRKNYVWILAHGGCPIANTLTETDDTNARLHRITLLFVRKWQRNIEALIATGKQGGEFKQGADGAATGRLLLTLISGGVMFAKATNEDSFFESALAQAEKLICEITEG